MEVTLAVAKSIIEHAFEERKKQGFKPLAVVVLGSGGSIKASESSRALFERAKVEPFFIQSMNSLCDGHLVPVPGGVLIRNANSELIGAVGVTGDTSDNDELCAVAGIKAAGLIADTGA